jgi:glucose/arabinose dehydrogenase
VFGRDYGRLRASAMLWQRTLAPSDAAFVTQPGSSWAKSYLVAALRGRLLRRLTFTGDRVTGEQLPPAS